jgi:uncharacterized protein (TIGR03437 family)
MLLAVLAPTLCTGLLHAATGLSLSTTTATTMTCNTAVAGPLLPVTITVKPGTDVTYPVVVTPGPLPAGLVVSPSSQTLTSSNAAAGVPFILSAAQGCAGAVAGVNTASTFHFMANQNGAGAVADTNNVTTTITVTATASGLSATASASSVSCLYNGSTYSPTPSTIAVTVANTEVGGTPFTLTKPTWLALATNPPYTVTSSLTSSVINFTPICSGPVGTVNSGSITLTDSPAPAVTLPVTYKVVSPATLTATTPSTQSYTKGSGSSYYPSWTVTLAGATTGQIYSVNPTTLGSWLTASPMSGAFGTSNVITFQATGGIDALAAQAAPYTQTVHISVPGYADTTVNVSVVVNNPSATLSFAEGNVRNLTWVQGQGIPTAIITAISSNSPIQYSTTSSGAIAPIIAATETSGLAYNFGTEIPVTFPNLPFSEAQPGSVLSGAVKFAWGTTTSTVTFYVTVQGGTSTAILNSAAPTNLPTAATGEQFTVTLYGSGFVPLADPTQRTTVGIVSNNQIVQDTNIINTQVVNSSTIVLTIQAPAISTDALLPWTGTNVTFGVCNPSGGTCTAPTGTFGIVVGAGPTISGIVSASTLTSASTPNVAPYDILTIWGSNFCTANGTGCGANGILYGVVNPANAAYTTALSPDGGQRNLTVSFKAHSAAASTYVAAPLLFATNSQINLVVPATGFPGSGAVDVLVSFGGLNSNVFAVTSAPTDPGVFMVDTYGQGAILNTNYSLASGSNPAVTGSVVQIYSTGLGTPTSLTVSTPVVYNSVTCITPANYEALVGSSSVDGMLIQSILLPSNLPPCFGTGAPSSIKVGGVTATIGYTGWVADSVAGLYQANATLPAATSTFTDAAGTSIVGLRSPVQLPVQITSGGVASPAPGTNLGLNPGVTMWVTPPALTVSSLTAQTAANGGAWTPTVTASGGTAPYTFVVDNSASPATGGLVYTVASPTLSFVTAPTAYGVYLITVTATDAHGVTGSTTFTLTVTDGSDTSTVTAAATAVTASTYGTSNAAVTTVTGGGGTGPYTYTVTPSAVFSVSATGVVSTVANAASGIYHAYVTVTDSLAAARNIYFDAPVSMAVTATNNVVTLTGIANLSTTQALTTVGNVGGNTVTYALVQPDSAKCNMTLVSNVLTVPATCVAGTYSVTVVGTDTAPTNSATGAVATLNLSVHLN